MQSKPLVGGTGMWRLGWASALCVVLLAGYAQAQTIPTKKAKRHSISARKPAPPASDQERPPATPKSKAGGGCGHAEHQPRKGPVVPDSGAQWSCAQPIVTAEPVWVGSRVEFVFKIKNEGTSELRIKAKGGWGTRIDGRSDRTIAPGTTEDLKVIVTAKGRRGPFTKRITVTTNDPRNPKTTLSCKGTVLGPVQIKPSAVRFQQIPRDAPPQHKIVTITRGDGGPIAPELLPISQAGVEASLTEIQAGEKYDLKITLSPPWPSRPIRSRFQIKTGVKEAPTLTIGLRADIEPLVKAMPAKLTIPQGLPEPVERRIRLTWAPGLTNKIISASSADPGLTLRVEDVDGRQEVVVQAVAGYRPRGFGGSISIRTDSKESPIVRVPVRAERTSSANMVAAKSQRDRKEAETKTASARSQSSTEPHAKPVDSPLANTSRLVASRAARMTDVQGNKPNLKIVAREEPKPAPAPAAKPSEKDGGCGGGTDDKTTLAQVAAPAGPGTAPKWQCDKTLVKSEPVWAGEMMLAKFQVSNPGTADLLIKVKGGWGTKVSGRSDRVIKPGASEQITVRMTTKNRSGTLKRRITVTTNDPDHPKVTINCEGQVLVPFKVSPRSIRFSRIKRDSPPLERKTIITRGDGGPLDLKLLPVLGSNIEADLIEVEPGERYELKVTVSPPWPDKRLRGALKFTTGVAQSSEGSIRVVGDMVPPVEAIPNRFILRGQTADGLEGSVRLAWGSGSNHRITGATVSDSGLSVRVDDVERGEQRVVVTASLDYVRGKGRPMVTVRTDDPENPILQVPVLIVGSQTPNLGRGFGPGAATTRVNAGSRPIKTGVDSTARPAGELKPASSEQKGVKTRPVASAESASGRQR